MPIGVYQRTDAHKKALSEAAKRRYANYTPRKRAVVTRSLKQNLAKARDVKADMLAAGKAAAKKPVRRAPKPAIVLTAEQVQALRIVRDMLASL